MKPWKTAFHRAFDRREALRRLGALAAAVALPVAWSGFGRIGKAAAQGTSQALRGKEGSMSEKVIRSAEEWRKILTPEQFDVLRKKGTERAFTGQYHDFKGKGVYQCAGCALDLFSSETKFDSGTGWPSFWAPISEHAVRKESDNSLFMRRTEVLCARCDGHLGHVFDDGPPPTGLRYCMNSVALKFVERGAGT
jgi:peptide-methionine (R)-S-oxide reductase